MRPARHSQETNSINTNNYNFSLSEDGAASPEVAQKAHETWADAARKNGIDLSTFNPSATLLERIAWAIRIGLTIAVIYTRFSTKRQGSTQDQVRACIEFAARNKMYTPPELISCDEGQKGRSINRPGLERLKQILKGRQATVLLIYKLSRLFRQAYRGIQFFREALVEEGLRGISVSESIDTNDKKGWRLQTSIRGAMDEELLDAIGDHVREGRTGLFLHSYTTGAIAIGYYAKEIPGAPKTKRGLPRTTPAVEEKAAAMVDEHFHLIAEGMDLVQGVRKWRADGGPVDPRSTTGKMSYSAYRRMLQRPEYTGKWQFGRKRNNWSAKVDGIRQEIQPEDQVKTLQIEELRIVDDETFFKVQERLNAQTTGPRPRTTKAIHHLRDLVIGVFHCPYCQGKPRFHMAGAGGRFMRCPVPDCPHRVMVDRHEAVQAICAELTKMLAADEAFVDEIVKAFDTLGADDVDEIDTRIANLERQVRSTSSRISELEDLAGSGSDEDRQRRKNAIQAAAVEKNTLQMDLSALKRAKNGHRDKPITREEVIRVLHNLGALLDSAAKGELGQEVVGKAVDTFRRLVGGSVEVHAQQRGGRKRSVVKGHFAPNLMNTIKSALGATVVGTATPGQVVEVWLREPPLIDRMGDEVQRMYDVEQLGYSAINQKLEDKYKVAIGTGNCCAAYTLWYKSHGLPLPPRRGNGGRPRKVG